MKEERVEKRAAREAARAMRVFWVGVNVEKGGFSSGVVLGGGVGGRGGGCFSSVLRVRVEVREDEDGVSSLAGGRDLRTEVPRDVVGGVILEIAAAV